LGARQNLMTPPIFTGWMEQVGGVFNHKRVLAVEKFFAAMM
jgi:hypothetical protein